MKDNPASYAHKRGHKYEILTAARLTDLGYQVVLHDDTSDREHDLIVNGLAVEVKGSKPYPVTGIRHRLGFGFAIKRINGDATTCDIMVLMCLVDPLALFIIPRVDLNGAHFIAIPNQDPREYKGKWSSYLDRFDLLDQAIAVHAGPIQGRLINDN